MKVDDKIKNILNRIEELKNKKVKILISGFIEISFIIDDLESDFQADILKLEDAKNNSYVTINLNQTYDAKIDEYVIELYMDNDVVVNIRVIWQNKNHVKINMALVL